MNHSDFYLELHFFFLILKIKKAPFIPEWSGTVLVLNSSVRSVDRNLIPQGNPWDVGLFDKKLQHLQQKIVDRSVFMKK